MSGESKLCEAPHDTPRLAAPGSRVCDWHRSRTRNALASLPVIHRTLEHYLVATGNGGSGGPIVTTSRDPGIRIDYAVAAARRDIESCLVDWTTYALPRIRVTRPTRRDPGTLATWLITHTDWFLAQDIAKDFTEDTDQTARRARTQRQHNHAATFEVGPCPEPDCPGTLITRLRPADSLLPSVIWCDAKPTDPDTGEQLHLWPADKWLTLGRRVHREETG